MQIHSPIISIDGGIRHMVKTVASQKVPREMDKKSPMGIKLKRTSNILSRESPCTE